MARLYSWNDITKIYLRCEDGREYIYKKEKGKDMQRFVISWSKLLEVETNYGTLQDVYRDLCKSSDGSVEAYSLNQDEINKRLMLMELVG